MVRSMELLRWLRGDATADDPAGTQERASAEDLILAAITERQASFSMADALALPAVARAVDLITSIASSFAPVEYRDGVASPVQPRLVRRPDPFRSRQEWIGQTVLSLIDRGEFYWLLGEQVDGYPSHALVLPPDEVDVSWDDRRFFPRYAWRGRELIQGQTIYHGAINRAPGQLHGRSALRSALPYLATIASAETFAALSFGAGGVPNTVLKTAADLTKDEVDRLKARWAESRRRSAETGEPAVAAGGIEVMFPDIDPQRMQLTEARSLGATVVARLLGIPSALLLAETHGSSVNYSNVDAIADQLVKLTVLPLYLAPIEAALGDLVPRTKTVRFSLSELVRADVQTRFAVYAQAIDSGVMQPAEARAYEGWPADPSTPTDAPLYDPTPSLATRPTAVPKKEVPSA